MGRTGTVRIIPGWLYVREGTRLNGCTLPPRSFACEGGLRNEIGMSGRIVIGYATRDAELGLRVVQFLQTMLDSAEVSGSSLPGHVPEGGDDSLAALKQRLASADVVVGLFTSSALTSGEVAFQLGAAWFLGTRLVLLLGPGGSETELYLPMGHAETLVLGPEALIELARSLGATAPDGHELSVEASRALLALFPDFTGFDRQSSERPVARPSATSGTTQQLWPVSDSGEPAEPTAPAVTQAPSASATRNLPSCNAATQAGRAISDCVFHREQGSGFARELDLPFGTFLTALGSDWSALRKLDDLDVWLETAENVLASLEPDLQHIAAFYEMGYQVATLINLAHVVSERAESADPKLTELWRDAYAELREAAAGLPAATAAIEELQPLLENLYGPEPPRDAANLGRVQERVRELANLADTSVLAASA
jgi:hypothetical protein